MTSRVRGGLPEFARRSTRTKTVSETYALGDLQGFFFVGRWPGLHFGSGGRYTCAGPKDAIAPRLTPALSTHAPLPEHDPAQPLKAEPLAAAATSCTRVLRSKIALQVPGQVI